MSVRKLILPRTAADLLNPERRKDMRAAGKILQAFQNLKLTLQSSGGQISRTTMQIVDRAALIEATATTAQEVTESVTSSRLGLNITVSTSSFRPGKFVVTWNNAGADGGTNLYYVAGYGADNTTPAFFTKPNISTGGPTEMTGPRSAWILVFASTLGSDVSHWIRIPL